MQSIIAIITVTLVVTPRQVNVVLVATRRVLIALAVHHGLPRDPTGITATLVISIVIRAVLHIGANGAA